MEDNKTNKVIDIISKYSSKRDSLMSDATGFSDAVNTPLYQVTSGGAIIFVLNVDRFEKV